MDFKSKKNKFFLNLVIVLLIFTIDRISKIYVLGLFEENFENSLFESKFLNIYLIWNEGIAFGLMSFSDKSFYNTLTIVILLVTILILYMSYQNQGLRRYAM